MQTQPKDDRNDAARAGVSTHEGSTGCCGESKDPCCARADTAGGDGEGQRQGATDDLAGLRRERDEAQERYIRALADYQNFQRRAALNEQEARTQGVTGVLHKLIPVLDHFDMALSVDTSKSSAGQVLEGVKSIAAEFQRVLALFDVAMIRPEANAEFDPVRHSAILRQPAEGVEPGRVSMTVRTGYTIGGRVVRPAEVAVAP